MESKHLERQFSVEKVGAILAGAMQVFLEHGFAATTMDQVSAAAGVSKTTVYSHFQDKEGLFNALIQELVQKKYCSILNFQQAQSVSDEVSVSLRQLASHVLNNNNTNQQWVAFIRLIIGESGRFPELARAFVSNLEKVSLQDLSQFLASHTELNLSDPEATARIFIGTLVHFLIIQELLHGKDILPMESERLIDNLIDLITVNQTAKNLHADQYTGTRQKSSRRNRTDAGKFTTDYRSEPKRLRSIRLTDTAWENLAAIAATNDLTRSELIEMFARNKD